MSDRYYGPPSLSSTGAPPPPPKPYSTDASRSETPIAAQLPQQHAYPQQYPQQPPLPPPNPQSNGPPLPPQQPTSPQPGSQHYQYDATQHYQQPATAYQQPQISLMPTTFELPESINKYTTADLQKLLSDSTLLNSVAQLHTAYTSALRPLHSQIEANTTLANQLSALEVQIKSLRDKTGQLMLQHTSLRTQWRRKQSEMDEALAPWGPRAMYQRLIASISEQEAMLIAVQESFVEGSSETPDYYGSGSSKASEKEVTDWVKRVREGAAALEKRREMRARWDEGRVGGWR